MGCAVDDAPLRPPRPRPFFFPMVAHKEARGRGEGKRGWEGRERRREGGAKAKRKRKRGKREREREERKERGREKERKDTHTHTHTKERRAQHREREDEQSSRPGKTEELQTAERANDGRPRPAARRRQQAGRGEERRAAAAGSSGRALRPSGRSSARATVARCLVVVRWGAQCPSSCLNRTPLAPRSALASIARDWAALHSRPCCRCRRLSRREGQRRTIPLEHRTGDETRLALLPPPPPLRSLPLCSSLRRPHRDPPRRHHHHRRTCAAADARTWRRQMRPWVLVFPSLFVRAPPRRLFFSFIANRSAVRHLRIARALAAPLPSLAVPLPSPRALHGPLPPRCARPVPRSRPVSLPPWCSAHHARRCVRPAGCRVPRGSSLRRR